MVTRKELREQREAAARAAAAETSGSALDATSAISATSASDAAAVSDGSKQPLLAPDAAETASAQSETPVAEPDSSEAVTQHTETPADQQAAVAGTDFVNTDNVSADHGSADHSGTEAAPPATSTAGAATRAEPGDGGDAEVPTKPKGRWRKIGCLGLAILLLLGLVVGGGIFFKQNIAGIFNPESTDYAGPGSGSVTVSVISGDTGSSIATKLKSAGVIKTRTAFLKAISASSTEPSFQPGTFTLKKHMKAKAALAIMTDSDNRNVTKVTIPEGFTVKRVIARMVKLGFDKAKLTAALANPTSLGIPSTAHDAEGWLFPATYQFNIGTTETAALKQMVSQTKQVLEDAGVAEKNWNKTIILASIVQKEARKSADFPKVARVLENRIDQDMLLQLDSTVAYGANISTVTTTSKQRADKTNKYNTYVHAGLPIGAISNPGKDAIEAVLKPAKGDWLYFVTINLKTGETVFSSDKAGHDAAVLKFRAWIQKNPDWNGS